MYFGIGYKWAIEYYEAAPKFPSLPIIIGENERELSTLLLQDLKRHEKVKSHQASPKVSDIVGAYSLTVEPRSMKYIIAVDGLRGLLNMIKNVKRIHGEEFSLVMVDKDDAKASLRISDRALAERYYLTAPDDKKGIRYGHTLTTIDRAFEDGLLNLNRVYLLVGEWYTGAPQSFHQYRRLGLTIVEEENGLLGSVLSPLSYSNDLDYIIETLPSDLSEWIRYVDENVSLESRVLPLANFLKRNPVLSDAIITKLGTITGFSPLMFQYIRMKRDGADLSTSEFVTDLSNTHLLSVVNKLFFGIEGMHVSVDKNNPLSLIRVDGPVPGMFRYGALAPRKHSFHGTISSSDVLTFIRVVGLPKILEEIKEIPISGEIRTLTVSLFREYKEQLDRELKAPPTEPVLILTRPTILAGHVSYTDVSGITKYRTGVVTIITLLSAHRLLEKIRVCSTTPEAMLLAITLSENPGLVKCSEFIDDFTALWGISSEAYAKILSSL